MRRTIARGVAGGGMVLGLVGLSLLGPATPASAHVTVNADEATQGGYTRAVFRVPNERDAAATTSVEVHLPEETPIRSVRTMPVPGWTAELTRTTLDEPVQQGDSVIEEAVTVITWTADDEDAAIQPDEFGEFPVSLGPLPEVEQLVFPSIQTYSNGEEVAWIAPPEPGGEPEDPAPVLELAAVATSSEQAPAPVASSLNPVELVTGEESDDGADGFWLGLSGLVLGAGGLVAGLLAYRKATTH